MFNDICFYVKGNMIKVNGQDFLLGELSASCMNIPPSEFEEIKEMTRQWRLCWSWSEIPGPGARVSM